MDKRCILQDRIWIDVRGLIWQIRDMSGEYRDNVIRYLRQQAPTWIIEAHAWVLIDNALGLITRPEARRRMALLRDLPEDWTDHTVLARRLRPDQE